MGDRCNLSVRVRTDQIKEFCKVTGLCDPDFFVEVDKDGKTADAEIEEADYGGYSDLLEAARVGLVFIGNHGSGSTYGPGRFAGVAGSYVENDCDYRGNLLLVVCDDGTISGHDQAHLRTFIKLERRAKRALNAKKPPAVRRKKGASYES